MQTPIVSALRVVLADEPGGQVGATDLLTNATARTSRSVTAPDHPWIVPSSGRAAQRPSA
jgi:hypothetical protein